MELREEGFLFAPAADVTKWVRQTFIDPKSELFNEDHQHLQSAEIDILWTNCYYSRKMRPVAGTAEIPKPHSALSRWAKARHEQQLRAWFRRMPDFLITLYAPYCAEIDDAGWCALIEHELYHCAQALDEFGFPKFTKEGRPRWTMKGHDAEEFVGVVARYGVGAAAGGTGRLVEAARQEPLIARAQIAAACGTCAR